MDRAGAARVRETGRTLGASSHELDALLGELGGDLEKLLDLVGHFEEEMCEGDEIFAGVDGRGWAELGRPAG